MRHERQVGLGTMDSLAVGAAAAIAGVVWTHSLAGVLRRIASPEAPLAAAGLTLAAFALAGLIAATLHRRVTLPRAAGLGAAGGLGAATAVEAAYPGAGPAALALPIVFAAVAPGARVLAGRLGGERRLLQHRGVAALWVLLSLAGVFQVGRLATFMTDPRSDFVLTTRNPFWYGHECLNAYLFGAELSERGVADLYDPDHYPALNPQARPVTRVDGMKVEDPYQYPPQFLLLPRLALAVSDHYPTLRVVWFGLQLTLFAAVYVTLALWIGGFPGTVALWSLPALLGAFPFLHNFQFGQFHLAAVALAVGGMLAFAGGRRATGGLLLASAVLAKVIPGVLLVPLLARRRWRELAWTGAWGLAITLVALSVVGPRPFSAFVGDHLPRLSSGRAFAFDEAWPDVADLVVADNQGAFGLAVKLGATKRAAARTSRAFALGVLALAAFVALRRRDDSRASRALRWLGLLGLASMASPGAWGDYTPTTALWALAVLLGTAQQSRPVVAALATATAFQYLLLGTMPLGDWAPPDLMRPVATVGLLLLLAVYLASVAGRPRAVFARRPLTPRVPEGLARAA